MQLPGNMMARFGLVFFLAGLAILLGALILGSAYPAPAQAQGPLDPADPSFAALAPSFQIVKKSNALTVTAGSRITFTIFITNTGPDPAPTVIFYDDYPAQLTNVAYAFSRPATKTTLIPNPKPTWVLTASLPVNQRLVVTVTGILTSTVNVTVTNTAKVTNFFPEVSNQASVNVGIYRKSIGPGRILYLPAIFKPVKLILVYLEDFNVGQPWFEGTIDSGCVTNNTSGQYWVDLEKTNRTCLPPAPNVNKPSSPYITYGEFEVAAYHSEGPSEAWYGIFINGQGGNNYYLFRIQPNEDACTVGGDWELIRRAGGNEVSLAAGSCHPAIRRGYGVNATNILRITHKSDRKIAVIANGTLLGTVTDNSSNHLVGTAPGLYVRSDIQNIRIKFDNFTVYR
jgi:uncharacterized repeat protein (TIGR01451 family)